MQNIIGIDIGGTKCAIILGRNKVDNRSGFPDLSIIDKYVYKTETTKGPEYMLEKIQNGIEEILIKYNISKQDISRIGISCGGPLDSKKGIIMSPPNLPGWDDIRIVEIFENKFGIKASLENDANACALAEWKYGAAKSFSNVIFLTFGTGFGAGMILDGRLYSGTNGMAGEIGHVRLESFGPVGYGKCGSAEGFCSGGGIAQLAKTKILEKLQMGEAVSFCSGIDQIDLISAKLTGDAAEAGDELAAEIYRISGAYLGRALSILIDILNPEIIVIGSIYARSTALLRDSMMDVINSESIKCSRKACKIVPAGLGEKIGDYAALAIAAYA